jgi:hypothetical protein
MVRVSCSTSPLVAPMARAATEKRTKAPALSEMEAPVCWDIATSSA